MSFKTFLLCLLLVLVAAFAYFRFSANGDPNSYFNQHTRYSLGKYKFLRTLFSLHNDGDAREEYLSARGPIVVEIVKPSGISLDDQVIKRFADKVAEYTGQQVTIFNNDTIPGGTLSEKDLDLIVVQHRRYYATNPDLFIIYAEDYEASGNEIARTYKEAGMVLSDKRLRELTQADSRNLGDYQESTMLHEFGHQLGLAHNDGQDCVMNAAVESPEKMEHFFSDITPTSFCDLELSELRRIQAGQ